MEQLLIGILIGAGCGSVGGYLLSTHIHSIAAKAVATAQGDLGKLSSKMGIGGVAKYTMSASKEVTINLTLTVK